MNKRVIVLEDEECVSNVIKLVGKKFGFDVNVYSNIEDLLDDIAVFKDSELFITDFNLHDSTSIDVLKELKHRNIVIYTILNSGNPMAMKEIEKAGLSDMVNECLDKTTNFKSFFEKMSNN